MNLKVELVKKKTQVRGLLRSEQGCTDPRVTRIINDRIYFKVSSLKELEEFCKFGNVQVATIQFGHLLFSQNETANPLENTIESDEDYKKFLENPNEIAGTTVQELPLDTSTTPLLEAIKGKKLQKSKSKKELYQPNYQSPKTQIPKTQSPKPQSAKPLGKSKRKKKSKDTADKKEF